MPLLLDSLDQHMYASESQNSIPSQIPRYTPRLVSRIDYGFDQCSVLSFVIKKCFVFIYGERVYIGLIIQMYFMQIYF